MKAKDRVMLGAILDNEPLAPEVPTVYNIIESLNCCLNLNKDYYFYPTHRKGKLYLLEVAAIEEILSKYNTIDDRSKEIFLEYTNADPKLMLKTVRVLNAERVV